jgi:hypothetical protein
MVREEGSREASPSPDYVCLLLAALHCTSDCPSCAGAAIGLSDHRIGRPRFIGDYRDIHGKRPVRSLKTTERKDRDA